MTFELQLWLLVVIGVGILAIGGIIGYLIGYGARRAFAEKTIGSAEREAERLVSEATKEAEAKSKEMLLAAKEEILKQKTEADRENKERRQELVRLENRALSKEEALDRKLENYEHRSEALDKKSKEVDQKLVDVEKLKADQLAKLEEISGYTLETAKQELVSKVEEDVKREASTKILEIEAQLKEDAQAKAQNIISLAIQRLASETVSNSTVSVVTLPNDETKGRIIGREGRNITKIEALTGVDLIIDDTPEAITLSCFDPIRREVARITLEHLVEDGRINPTKIEETVKKAVEEVEYTIKKAGEKAALDAGVNGLNPDIIRFLGKLKYRTSYGQNVLNHSIETAHICGIIANELGLDSTMARRAGLLHDIGKSLTQEVEGSHVQLGVEIAKKYKENKYIIHAIEAHHGDVEAQSVLAVIVQAADAISAARPGARREDLETYIKRLQKLEEIASSFDGIDKSYALQAGREIRILVKPEKVNDDQMPYIAREVAKRIEAELEYPGEIKVNVIRESKSIDYAR